MQVVYAQQPLEKSIFLVGPTPRSKDVASWRPEALRILEELKFEGKVYVPEMEEGGLWEGRYVQQVEWEWEALSIATVIACWVPRDLVTLPGFITNVEFGKYDASGKLLLGYPRAAQKMRYLALDAQRFHIPIYRTLPALLKAAVEKAKRPYPVQDVEPF